ncbi:hypothetical protein GHT09_004039 [Marmota monax]|uniref:NTR domain-containing protein n=1 Tax=Marmota monax TaxID=9995 RepID=A0A834UP86_MARMO|nr:hypothetical protein GHT09_004039 [Marmota monax]
MGLLRRTHLNARWPTRHLPTALRRVPPGFIQMLSHQSRDGTFHVIKRRPTAPGPARLCPVTDLTPPCHPGNTPIPPAFLPTSLQKWLLNTGDRPRPGDPEKAPPPSPRLTSNSIQARAGHPGDPQSLEGRLGRGGYKGSEADVSLRALVLVALREGKELCSPRVPNLDGSIRKACGFLETKLPHVLTTFAMAIASYALALAKSRLDSFASRDRTHWPVGSLPQNSLYPVEATAYALMQKLELGLHNDTDAINKWLLEKRELGGGFGSTQTTVVTLEALTRFSLAVPFEGIQDLQVQISTPCRSLHKRRLIDQNRARPALQHLQVPGAEDLEMKASGRGRGTISLTSDVEMYAFQYETKASTSNSSVVLYLEKLQAIIKSDPAMPLSVKKFVTQATCYDSLGLREQESYLIMGLTSDLWRVKSEYSYPLGKKMFLMLWPSDRDRGKKDLLAQLEGFSEHLSTHGCES